MSNVLPQFRTEVSVTLQSEENESFLILHDPFGFAEGPIMIHADMVDLLEQCDGITTWSDIATEAGVEADGAEILRAKAFVAQLAALGFLEGEAADQKRATALHEWDASTTRPPVCAGSTYPSDVDALKVFLDELIPDDKLQTVSFQLKALLIPHIDFRVAPHSYAPGFNALRETDADLFVMIGTSHYWADDRIVLTSKNYETPFGVVETDQEIVAAIRNQLGANGSDIAHKPEHSLELHMVGLQHVMAGEKFSVVPILVTSVGGAEDPSGFVELQQIAAEIHKVVSATGRKAVYLISGDMAHIGKKFGDDVPSLQMLDEVGEFDQHLLEHLEGADPIQIHEYINEDDNRFRICGHAPTILALQAAELSFGPLRGQTLRYDVWNEAETHSSVTFATVAWVLK